jgi:oligopeptide transport system permease protein
MWRFLYRRLLFAVPTLLVIVTLAFTLLRLTPGGPFDGERPMLPEIRRSLEAHYHLDQPVVQQYFSYLRGLARADLGPSFQYRNTSVNELVAQGLPVDAAIGCAALLLALLSGGLLGTQAALHRGTWRDYLCMSLAALGKSLPVMVIAPVLILLFANTLHWLPAGDWVSGSWRHMLLPVIALAFPYSASVARLLRGSLIESLASPYVRTAIAKGLPARTVLLRHALRPALQPIIAFLGPAFAGVITGSIVIESVFGLPGIGRQLITGALNRDYTVVMGITVLYGALIVLFNLLADLVAAWLDPRLRVQQ